MQVRLSDYSKAIAGGIAGLVIAVAARLSDYSKAIAGGIAGLVIAVAARYGFHADPATASAISVLSTAIVGYAIGHLAVYLAPKNTNGGTPNVG